MRKCIFLLGRAAQSKWKTSSLRIDLIDRASEGKWRLALNLQLQNRWDDPFTLSQIVKALIITTQHVPESLSGGEKRTKGQMEWSGGSGRYNRRIVIISPKDSLFSRAAADDDAAIVDRELHTVSAFYSTVIVARM